jgi:hypothetical protein
MDLDDDQRYNWKHEEKQRIHPCEDVESDVKRHHFHLESPIDRNKNKKKINIYFL